MSKTDSLISPTDMSIDMGASDPSYGGDDNWVLSSLCSQTDPEAFFPERGDSGFVARKLCMQCPVRAECFREGMIAQRDMPDGMLHGIWGGYGSQMRSRMYRELTDYGSKSLPSLPELRMYLEMQGAPKNGGANKWG